MSITYEEKAKVAHALQSNEPIPMERLVRYVPEHVSQEGQILEKVLAATDDPELLRQWAKKNLPTGAPCGDGNYLTDYDGVVFNDDTEGGFELSVSLTLRKDGVMVKVDDLKAKIFPFPVSGLRVAKALETRMESELKGRKVKAQAPDTPRIGG